MAVAEVEHGLVVVRCGGVLSVLIEAYLSFVQHTVQVDPGSAVGGGNGARSAKTNYRLNAT